MSDQFPGFEKSAPTSLPGSDHQGQPTSSWDWSASSFEKVIERYQENSSQRLLEEFTQQLVEERLCREKEHGEMQNTIIGLQQAMEAAQQKMVLQIAEFHRDSTQMLVRVEHQCERMANVLESLRDSIMDKSAQSKKFSRDDLAYWLFLGILLLFFFLYFIVPRYMS